MRNVKMPYCLSLLFLVVVFAAAGSAPLASQTAQIGPYHLLLNFYSLPRVGQQLNMTIEPQTPGMSLHFSQVMLKPASGTDAIPTGVTISPDNDTPNVYDINVTPSVRGQWLLHLTVSGPAGSFVGEIPIDVQAPPLIPTWLGWLIGLLPLPLLIIFFWWQLRWHNAHRKRMHQERLTTLFPVGHQTSTLDRRGQKVLLMRKEWNSNGTFNHSNNKKEDLS